MKHDGSHTTVERGRRTPQPVTRLSIYTCSSEKVLEESKCPYHTHCPRGHTSRPALRLDWVSKGTCSDRTNDACILVGQR